MARGRLGVIGAGTMGLGIVQLATLNGFDVVAVEADEGVREAARSRLRAALAKGAERRRWTGEEADEALSRARFAAEVDALRGHGVVIEAVPERLELKREVLEASAEVVGSDALLATNTSSLSVSEISLELPHPSRVVGLHFFNPPALMRLVEVVPGDRTSAQTLEAATTLVRQLGREPIRANDTLGFVVNRCARPFVGEALRLLIEGVASVEAIDRICREAGGFRLGPLELTDLIGLDVNLEIQESFWRQSYCEPRWRPTLLQASMVKAGRLGRKSGRGFYEYPEAPQPQVSKPPAPAPERSPKTVEVRGSGTIAEELREAVASLGIAVTPGGSGEAAELCVDASLQPTPGPTPTGPWLVCCAAGTLAEHGVAGAVGFDLATPLSDAKLLELSRNERTGPTSEAAAEGLAAALGKQVEWTVDSPGLVLGRIVAQLVNEAAFAVQEGVASDADIDLGMRLGMNFPRGPIAWREQRGATRWLATLDALRRHTGEERYRAAPLLRRISAGGGASSSLD